MELLSKIAATEPQSAYCAFTAGFKYKVFYTMRTIPDICQYLQKLDHYVEKAFLYQLLLIVQKHHIAKNIERKLLTLPVKRGGMGTVISVDIAKKEYRIQETSPNL